LHQVGTSSLLIYMMHGHTYDKINVGYLMHLVGCFIQSLSRCTVTWT